MAVFLVIFTLRYCGFCERLHMEQRQFKQMHVFESEQPSQNLYLSVVAPSPVAPAALLKLVLQESKPVDAFCAAHTMTIVPLLQFLF